MCCKMHMTGMFCAQLRTIVQFSSVYIAVFGDMNCIKKIGQSHNEVNKWHFTTKK